MGSCVSKTKAARAKQGKVAAPLPPVVEKEGSIQTSALPPPVVVVVVVEEEEEVKEVVLSETPVPRPVKRRQQDQRDPGPGGQEAEDEAAASSETTTCSASDSASAAKEVVARLQKAGGGERREVVEKRAPEKGRTAAREDRERESKKAKAKGGGGAGGRARSPSPSSAHRRQQQQQQPQSTAQRREHPTVVSGIGCRSGRFSPSAARRAAESAAVRRTHSAREADMALPSSKRSLMTRRDPGERSWRRSDSPTGRRATATTSPMRNKAKEHGHGTPERGSRQPRASRDGGDEQPAAAACAGGGEQQMKRMAAALGQNPSVAMECFIFL